MLELVPVQVDLQFVYLVHRTSTMPTCTRNYTVYSASYTVQVHMYSISLDLGYMTYHCQTLYSTTVRWYQVQCLFLTPSSTIPLCRISTFCRTRILVTKMSSSNRFHQIPHTAHRHRAYYVRHIPRRIASIQVLRIVTVEPQSTKKHRRGPGNTPLLGYNCM
jgi:hypothetical protein